MILHDYEKAAAFWRNGAKQPELVICEIDRKPFSFRNGWAGSAFEWNPFCVNALVVGGKKFLRGWGMICREQLTCRVELPQPADELALSVGINDSHDPDHAARRVSFRILDVHGGVLGECEVGSGEIKPLRADLKGTTSFLLQMTEANGKCCSVDWLEPVITCSDGTRILPGERGNPPAELAIRFDYDGVPFDPAVWPHTVSVADRSFHHVWRSPDAKLELRVEARIHDDYHVIELIPELAAVGGEATGIVENFRSLDFRKRIYDLPHNGAAPYREAAPLLQPELVLHRNYGSRATGSDFLASEVRMSGRQGMNVVTLDTDEGRSSAAWLPFFQIELADDRRIDFAVGWSGAWQSRIQFISEDTFEVTAGLRKTHFRLLPGECIRQPSSAVHFAVAPESECRNEFRRFLIDHRLPRDSRGELLLPPTSMMFSGTLPNTMLLDYLRIVETHKLPLEVFWVDAGWYGPDREVPLELHLSDWGWTVGDWRVNQVPHPGGLRPVTDALHRTGRRFLLWVETERADKNTAIVREHPEYFISAGDNNRMLDLGNDAACDYAIETVSQLISSEGVDCYREDFNFNTIPFWDAADAPDRVGIAESRFITGFYRFWSTLRKRFPDLLIDNCASGGRRIDLETIALSIPLWRSDFQCFPDIPYLPEANQIHFDGLSSWIPFHCSGTVLRGGDDYAFLSGALGSSLVDLCNRRLFEPREGAFDFDWLRRMLELAIRMRGYLTGNYYRLTEHPEDFRRPFAFELFDPERQAGCVAAFRREAAPEAEIPVALREIDPAARYEVELIPGGIREVSGEELIDWKFELPTPRSCRVMFFRKTK